MTNNTILIIEDDTALQDLLCELLISHSYGVESFSRGIDGVSRAKVLQPDCILIDLTLPDITGIDVMRQLKANSKTATIPIVVLSRLIDNVTRETVLELGSHTFINKPFDVNDLLKVLDDLLSESIDDD